jgi:hypothetical protein
LGTYTPPTSLAAAGTTYERRSGIQGKVPRSTAAFASTLPPSLCALLVSPAGNSFA